MSKQESHIHIPDADETARYGGGDSAERRPGAQADIQAAESAPSTEEDLQKQVAEWKDKCLRARAELQNVQRRYAAERTDLTRYANTDFARALLGVLTDVERTIAAAQKSSDAAALLDGVRLVQENFLKVLGQFGVEPISALHSSFDPNLHEALMQQPTSQHPPGTVIQELERGYMLHDRVLRPSRVVIASAPADDGAGGVST